MSNHLAVIGSELDLSRVDVESSRAYLLLGDIDAAERFANAALERLGDPPRLETAFAQVSRGDALHARGDTTGSAQAYDRALREAGFRPTIPLSSWETWSLI